MKFGCSVLTIEEARTVKEAGYDYLEFQGKYVAGLADDAFEALVSEMETIGITSYGINAYTAKDLQFIGAAYDPAAARAYADRLGARAQRLGAKMIGIGSPFSRTLPSEEDRPEAMRTMADFLKVTAETFAKYDMTVCLEPLSPKYCNFINTAEEGLELIAAVNLPNVKLVIDWYNLADVGEGNLDLKPIAGSIAHFHTSDDDGHKHLRSYLHADNAAFHVACIERMLEIGYDGGITVEMDIKADLERAKESLAMLKNAARV